MNATAITVIQVSTALGAKSGTVVTTKELSGLFENNATFKEVIQHKETFFDKEVILRVLVLQLVRNGLNRLEAELKGEGFVFILCLWLTDFIDCLQRRMSKNKFCSSFFILSHIV